MCVCAPNICATVKKAHAVADDPTHPLNTEFDLPSQRRYQCLKCTKKTISKTVSFLWVCVLVWVCVCVGVCVLAWMCWCVCVYVCVCVCVYLLDILKLQQLKYYIINIYITMMPTVST